MAVKFGYFVKESGSSMRRNLALAIAAIMVTTFSLMILGLISMSVHYLNGVSGIVKGRVDEIRVFLKDDITVEEQKSMDMFIRRMSEVASVTYVSKDQALKEFQQMYKDQSDILKEIEGNPLPAEFKVRMKDPKYNHAVAKRIESRPEVSTDPNTGKKEVKFPEAVVNKVISWTSAIQKVGVAWVLAFCLVAVALVSITIRMAIYSRRKEIGIMKLVGATNWFIRWPFMIEGIFEGIMGGLVAVVVVCLLSIWPFGRLEALAEHKNLIGNGYLTVLALLLVLVGAVIGAIGSALALRRYTEV